jgi:hypothetical protein
MLRDAAIIILLSALLSGCSGSTSGEGGGASGSAETQTREAVDSGSGAVTGTADSSRAKAAAGETLEADSAAAPRHAGVVSRGSEPPAEGALRGAEGEPTRADNEPQRAESEPQPAESEPQTTEGASHLRVVRAYVCKGIEESEPTEAGKSFVPEEGVLRLCCFSEIAGATGPDAIYHVWRWGDREMARVRLEVKGASWRTWSTKRILDEWRGEWHVDITDSKGVLLSTLDFSVE